MFSDLFDIMRLFDYYHDVHSEYGEDGILYFFVKSLNIQNRPKTFLNICDLFKRKNMFLFCIQHMGFKSCVPLSHNQGKVECTLSGIKSLLREIQSVYIMCINTRGVDFWLLDTYMRNCKQEQKPVILFCKINAIVPFDKRVTVPYTPIPNRKEYYTQVFTGASLDAIHTCVRKDYTFVGTTRNATFAVFVLKHYVVGNVMYETYMFPQVIHARKQHRWNQPIPNKMWIQVK